MNPFTPSPEYAGLLVQARALHKIICCMEQTANAGSKHIIAKLKGQVPFRDGVHIVNDAEHLNLPAFAIVTETITSLSLVDGKIAQRTWNGK